LRSSRLVEELLVAGETAGAALYEERPVRLLLLMQKRLLQLIAWSDPEDACEFLVRSGIGV